MMTQAMTEELGEPETGGAYDARAFPAKLRALLKAQRLSQQNLADAIRTTQGQVSKWCRGESTPSVDLAVAMAEALGVSMDYLFRDTPDRDPIGPLTPGEQALIEEIRSLPPDRIREVHRAIYGK
jgi:transcriptional regulator with XRE-family HTH domain